MYEQDDSNMHQMSTRKKRRNYKCLEDGKEESSIDSMNQAASNIVKQAKPVKDNIISIDTHLLKASEKDVDKSIKSHNDSVNDKSKTSGRWTAEEHKKFVDALKKFGKQWKKVEEYIKTRSGAQIRSHAQKYFLKIQKEYPDQDSFEVFKSKTPEFLEDTIFMKRKDDSDDEDSSNSKNGIRQSEPIPQQEPIETKDQQSLDFAKSMNDMLARKRSPTPVSQAPVIPQLDVPNFSTIQANNDLLAIQAFFDHIKNTLSSSFA